MNKRVDRDPSHQTGREADAGWPQPGKSLGDAAGPHAVSDKARPNSPSTEPRGERGGMASSQGLAGAQGSGGGAERGVNNPPPRRKDGEGGSHGGTTDESGFDAAGGGGR